ncbi:putative secreted protein [Sphingomonas sp. UYAg733]
MRWTSALAIYFLFWAFSVFFVLPFGVRTSDEAGVARVPGQAESAPHTFQAGKVAIRVTIVATILFGLFMLNYHFGWVTPQSVDLFGALANEAG